MWVYLESLNWEKNMLPLARVMVHYELLERQREQERQDNGQLQKDICRALGERNDARAWSSKLADLADDLRACLASERALADRLAAVAKDCRPFCEPMRRRLIDEVIAAWKEARRA